MTPSPAPIRYGRTAVLLHWVLGVALLAEIVFGYALDTLAPRGTPSRAPVINLHKSFGIVLGVLIVLRLAWRLRHPPPAWTHTMPAWQRLAAEAGHYALYACMLAVPLVGYVASNFSRFGVRFFGLTLPPWGGDLPGVYSFLSATHRTLALALCVLIAGHVAMVLKHALVDRDDVFWRMWTRGRLPQPTEPSP